MAVCCSCGGTHGAGVVVCPETKESVTVGPCGSRVDRYLIEKRLGGGGFGSVYLARHSVLGHRVALKLLLARHAATAEVVARFVREAKSSATINNPHVVSVIDFGQTSDGAAFLVMELLDGRDLETVLREEGAFSPEWALAFCEQILEGLTAAHDAGIVHRDMKPANVFVTRRGDGSPWIKLVDFGISKAKDVGGPTQGLTRSGAMIGTPSYMPPEQFTGMRDVDHRADLYAVAVILYQMLSGRLPYEADSYERLIVKVCTEDPSPLETLVPRMPPSVLAVVRRGLKREPSERFQSTHEFRAALHQARAALHPGALDLGTPAGPLHPPHSAPPQQHPHDPATRPDSPNAMVGASHLPTPASHPTPHPMNPHTPYPHPYAPPTPMSFERPNATQQRSGTSPVLVGAIVLGAVGMLIVLVLVVIGIATQVEDDEDDGFATLATSSNVTTEAPNILGADPALIPSVMRVLSASTTEFNQCRLHDRTSRVSVRVLIQKGNVLPDPSSGDPLADCLATHFSNRANGAGPWPVENAVVTFTANVPQSP